MEGGKGEGGGLIRKYVFKYLSKQNILYVLLLFFDNMHNTVRQMKEWV